MSSEVNLSQLTNTYSSQKSNSVQSSSPKTNPSMKNFIRRRQQIAVFWGRDRAGEAVLGDCNTSFCQVERDTSIHICIYFALAANLLIVAKTGRDETKIK